MRRILTVPSPIAPAAHRSPQTDNEVPNWPPVTGKLNPRSPITSQDEPSVDGAELPTATIPINATSVFARCDGRFMHFN